MTDKEIIADMLRRANIDFGYTGGASILAGNCQFNFGAGDSLKDVGDEEPNYDDCPNCDDYEGANDGLRSVLQEVLSLTEDCADIHTLKPAKELLEKIHTKAYEIL